MIAWIKKNAGHVLGVALLVVAVFGFHSYMAEHDARLVADTNVKAAQVTIDALKGQQAAVTKEAKVQIIRLQEKAADVKTPEQAVAALPDVAPVGPADLHAEPIPDAPGREAVDVLPLYQNLNSCRQCSISLEAATKKLDLQTQIDEQKDAEITALKKKPGFWARVKSTGKAVGVGVLIGGGLAAYGLSK